MRRGALADGLALGALLVSGLTLASYVSGVVWLRRWLGDTAMAFNTALCFLLVAMSLLVRNGGGR